MRPPDNAGTYHAAPRSRTYLNTEENGREHRQLRERGEEAQYHVAFARYE